jgi:hypothetical protein
MLKISFKAQSPPPPIVIEQPYPDPYTLEVNGFQWGSGRNMQEIWALYRTLKSEGLVGDVDHVIAKDIRTNTIEASF